MRKIKGLNQPKILHTMYRLGSTGRTDSRNRMYNVSIRRINDGDNCVGIYCAHRGDEFQLILVIILNNA